MTARRLLLLAVVVAVGLTAAARAGRLASSGSEHSAAQQGSAAGALSVIRVTIRPTGFDPAALNVPRGRVLLAVDDLSGLDEVTLRLEREAGGRLREVRAGRDRSKWRGVLDLHPGAYLLGVDGRPGWACRINVTAD
jgi:hypothetical protein